MLNTPALTQTRFPTTKRISPPVSSKHNEREIRNYLKKWRTVQDVARAFSGWYNVNDVRRFVTYLNHQYRQNAIQYPEHISPEEEKLYFAVMTWLNLRIVQGQYDDALGNLYMAVGYPNRDSGQFFTPYHLCLLMAEMQLPQNRKEALKVASRKQSKKISVNDPTCGSGSLLCAAWEVAHKRGSDDLLSLSGQDIDPYCVAMTRINIIMRQELTVLKPYLLATC